MIESKYPLTVPLLVELRIRMQRLDPRPLAIPGRPPWEPKYPALWAALELCFLAQVPDELWDDEKSMLLGRYAAESIEVPRNADGTLLQCLLYTAWAMREARMPDESVRDLLLAVLTREALANTTRHL